jgi:endonuclease III
MPDSPLPQIIDALERSYGTPLSLRLTDPFHLILWENIGYLADDTRREAAFQALEERVGLAPEEILAAPEETLMSITRLGGIFPELRAERLRQIAETVIGEFGGDLWAVLNLPPAKAKKALGRFPSIGEPGAEKILLFAGALPVLALESNGLRALARLGYGEVDASYARMYRSAQQAASAEAPKEVGWLTKAHQLLKRHGQELCKRSAPLCGMCPVVSACRYARERSSAARRPAPCPPS